MANENKNAKTEPVEAKTEPVEAKTTELVEAKDTTVNSNLASWSLSELQDIYGAIRDKDYWQAMRLSIKFLYDMLNPPKTQRVAVFMIPPGSVDLKKWESMLKTIPKDIEPLPRAKAGTDYAYVPLSAKFDGEKLAALIRLILSIIAKV